MVRVKGPGSGVLVVDKPAGKTSHDVVAEARRLFGTRSVGHAGTLDPQATGVLLLLLGEATKLSPFLLNAAKRYRATVSFGRSTDTLDAQGKVGEARELASGWLSREALERALCEERARREQVPPAFSAIKVGGERAYRLSRQGREPALAPRPVEVHELELEAASDAAVTVVLTASKGYFVRSLARDLCVALGVPGHLSELRRLASGGFDLTEAVSWPPSESDLLPLSLAARRCLPGVTLAAGSVARARQGRRLEPGDFLELPPPDPCAWFDEAGQLVAIGRAAESGGFRVLRGFVAEP